MPRKYSRRRRSSKKRTKTNKKSKKMRGGVTRKLLTRRKVADLTREIGLGHGGSLNTRIKEFVRPALTNQSIHAAVQDYIGTCPMRLIWNGCFEAQAPSTSRSTLLGTWSSLGSSSQNRNDRLDFLWSGDLAIWR